VKPLNDIKRRYQASNDATQATAPRLQATSRNPPRSLGYRETRSSTKIQGSSRVTSLNTL